MYNISFSKVSKENAPYTALRNFSLSIEEGEAYALLAPKNSGKRTLISLLMGMLKPDSGSVKVSDYDCFSGRRKVHEIAGFVSWVHGLSRKYGWRSFYKAYILLAR